jgi:hypothetical protein
MRSQQTSRRGYSDEFKQVVLRPVLGATSLKKAKKFLAKHVWVVSEVVNAL